MKSKTTTLLILCIILLAGILRFVFLGQNPSGLTNDEADIGYDAYSILKTSRDQWGDFLPLTAFKGFGDYRLPLYTYLVVPSIALWGMNEFAVRFPSALLGTLTVLLTFFLGRKLANEKIGLISAFLLTISPWHIGVSRVGIESNAAIFLTVLSIYFFFLSFGKPKLLFITVLIAILDLYSYYSMRIFIPIILLSIFFLYRDKIPKIKKVIIPSLIVAVLLLSPIITSSIGSGQTRFGQITFFKDIGLINKIEEKRTACQKKFPDPFCRIIYNKPTTYLSTFLFNYANHFSFSLLFLAGSSTSLSVMPERGFFYLVELPLLIVGLAFLTLNRTKENLFLLVWILAAPIADSLTSAGHYSRMLAFLPALQIATAVGSLQVANKFKKISDSVKIAIFIGIFSIGLISFLVEYYGYYPIRFSRESHYGFKPLFSFLKNNEDKYSEIFISNKYYDTKYYIFYLFFTQYDPRTYQETVIKKSRIEKDGWIAIKQVGKYHFLNQVPPIESIKSTSLIVANPKELSEEIRTQKVIYDLKGDPIFFLVSGDAYTQSKSSKTDNL